MGGENNTVLGTLAVTYSLLPKENICIGRACMCTVGLAGLPVTPGSTFASCAAF